MTDHQNAIEQAKSLLKGQHDLIANAQTFRHCCFMHSRK
jgi:hypothetical protein